MLLVGSLTCSEFWTYDGQAVQGTQGQDENYIWECSVDIETKSQRRTSMDSLRAIVRKVRAKDKEDILEISRHIWGGNDYLPTVIDEWLRNRKCHTFGVEVNEHVVAVGNLRLVDKGRTGWMEGLRVHPDFRKLGFADNLTKYFVDLAPSLGIERLRYSTGINNRASMKLAKQYGFDRKLRMAIFWYENVTSGKKLNRRYLAIKEVAPKEAFALSRTEPSLIPYGVLIYDWKAVDATPQGFREVGKTHSFYVAEKNRTMDSLSFGTIRSEANQNRCSFTVYASSFEGLLTHMAKHVDIALEKDANLIVTAVDTRFEKLLRDLKWDAEFQWKMRLVLLEKTIKTSTD